MDLNITTVIHDLIAGNGLAAIHDIDLGNDIIQISSPYLLVVEKEALEKVCSFCLIEAVTSDSPLKRCSACKVPRYCSSDCQKKDWINVHQKECPFLRNLPDLPPTPVRALMQVLLWHRHDNSLDPRWAGLESHVEDLKKDKTRWDEIVLQAKAAVEFSKSPPDRMDVAIQVLCRMITNAFRATLADDTPVGLCFELTLALANHSCGPNAVVVFDGRSVALRALEPIEKGEQIFISYITATEDLDSRQSHLRQRYFFECRCEKCREDESPYSTFLRHNPKPEGRNNLLCNSEHLITNARGFSTSYDASKVLKGNLNQAKHCFELSQIPNTDHKTKKNLLKQGASACSPGKKLLALHPFPKIMHELYLTYLDASSYVNALVVLLFLFLNCDVYNYPQPSHPVRIIRLFTIAKLLKHLSSLPAAEFQALIGGVNSQPQLRRVMGGIDWIDSFHAVMIIVWEQGIKSHGKESRFMIEVEADLKDVEEVQRLRGEEGRKLRMWMDDEESVEGRKEAQGIFEGLKRLSECVYEILAL